MTGEVDGILTSDPAAFVSRLQPGDVLLFDGLHFPSHVIKMLDNSPVSHSAIYEGDGWYVQASPPGTSPQAKQAGAAVAAVRRENLPARLRRREDRTVTAMRHPRRSELAGGVLRETERWLVNSAYGYADLLGLAAKCFNRAYAKQWPRAARALVEASSTGAGWASRAFARGRPAELHVTCSEFVYSCYEAAEPDSLLIRDPLARWRGGRLVPMYRRALDERPSGRAGPPIVALEGLGGGAMGVELRPAGRRRRGGRAVRDDAFDELLRDEDRDMREQIWHNEDLGKYGRDDLVGLFATAGRSGGGGVPPPPSPAPPRREGAPIAEAVTPWDLWASESLEVVRVLHLPPVAGDAVRERLGQRRRGT